MSASVIERRRHRRVELPVTVSFRAVEQPSAAVPIVGHAKDVGLAGVYVVVPGSVPLTAGSAVFYTVEIPAEQQRGFPLQPFLGEGGGGCRAEKDQPCFIRSRFPQNNSAISPSVV